MQLIKGNPLANNVNSKSRARQKDPEIENCKLFRRISAGYDRLQTYVFNVECLALVFTFLKCVN
jgi:hypothetical protein